MPERPEIVLYVPAGGHPSTVGIPRGSAIVGRPQIEADEVVVHFQAGGPDRRPGRESLADRALIASGRLLEGVDGEGSRSVPREGLLVIGVFLFGEGRIVLTGRQSVRALADWLGLPQLGRAELRRRGASPGGPQVASVEAQEFSAARLDPALLWALLERGGVVAEGEEWLDPEGRRTTEVGDALIWALERLARGT